jgi:hypothetical protein
VPACLVSVSSVRKVVGAHAGKFMMATQLPHMLALLQTAEAFGFRQAKICCPTGRGSSSLPARTSESITYGHS